MPGGVRQMKLPMLLTAAAVLFAAHPAAAAQNNLISFVSSSGADTNTCLPDAPCRNLGGPTGAIAKTFNSAGTIRVLDAGNFKGGTINKSLAIFGDRLQTVIPASGFNALSINAPGQIVMLQGFSVVGPKGNIGIEIRAARAVHLGQCLIDGMSLADGAGIGVAIVTSEETEVVISDCTFTGNREAIRVRSNGSPVRVLLDRVVIDGNGTGIRVDGALASVRLHKTAIRATSPQVKRVNRGKLESYQTNAIGNVTVTPVPLH